MLQRVAKYVHKRHAILVVARRLDLESGWTAAYSVIFASGRSMPALRQIADPYNSHEEAVERARERACAYIDSRRSW